MTKYGLPEEVKFCKRCVISNQRPSSTIEYEHTIDSKKETIYFDDEGICDACRIAEAKESVDWESRQKELIDLCDRHRSKNGAFDCVVPGSGGKDSFYAAYVLKHDYGMHPLLVTWAPHIYTDVGWRNLQKWQAISDHILYTPNRNTHRLLTRLAVENLLHPFQPFIIGQKTLAPKIASQYKIPLVFYGEYWGCPIARIEGKI
jgi:tRNA(Ile)-lysidine synthase TilS/MesJ